MSFESMERSSVLDAFRLDGRVAVVTGASAGLGARFATALAGAGAKVVLAARRADRLKSVERLIRESGGEAVSVETDVTDPDSCHHSVSRAVTEYGHVDILVNSAGLGWAAPATREHPSEFSRVLDVNLAGAYWMAQACGRVMESGGSIVNIGSVLGSTTAGLPQAAYAASKSGLIGLTRDLAVQWSGRKGIRVNLVAPGFFATEMTDQYPPGYLEETVRARVPLGRAGYLDECAYAIIFLSSPAASYVTGALLAVDGGMLCT